MLHGHESKAERTRKTSEPRPPPNNMLAPPTMVMNEQVKRMVLQNSPVRTFRGVWMNLSARTKSFRIGSVGARLMKTATEEPASSAPQAMCWFQARAARYARVANEDDVNKRQHGAHALIEHLTTLDHAIQRLINKDAVDSRGTDEKSCQNIHNQLQPNSLLLRSP